MKNINFKVNVVLFIGFIIQIVLILSLYRFVIAGNILSEINSHEATRQQILNTVIGNVEKMNNNPVRIKECLEIYAKKYDLKFILKDMNENVVLKTFIETDTHRTIKETDFIRFYGRAEYFLIAYYPAEIKTLTKKAEGMDLKMLLLLIVLTSSIVTSLFINKMLTLPVRKISRAAKEMNYGNTEIQIPYHANDEIGELCRNFEDMGRRLKQSEENQVEMLQAISHDLKTPLTSILGYIKRLTDGKVSNEERKKEYYETIYRKSGEIKALIDELEDYTKENSSKGRDLKSVPVLDFVKAICKELTDDAFQRDFEFQGVYDLPNECIIKINESKIKRVIYNIIENSIKYCASPLRITLRAAEKDKFIIFEIEDNGLGLSEEHFDKIFDKFFRVENSRSRLKGGTGLGLSICKEIIEFHDGRIGAKTSKGGGLCIYFTIPTYEFCENDFEKQ